MVSRHLGMAVLASGLPASQAGAESFETRLSPSSLTDGTRINVTGKPTTLAAGHSSSQQWQCDIRFRPAG